MTVCLQHLLSWLSLVVCDVLICCDISTGESGEIPDEMICRTNVFSDAGPPSVTLDQHQNNISSTHILYIVISPPADTRRPISVGPTLVHHLRCCTNVEPTPTQCMSMICEHFQRLEYYCGGVINCWMLSQRTNCAESPI